MEFAYRLTGTGWAEAEVRDKHASVVVTASYLSDALGELLLAIASLQDGDDSAVCSWAEEPGEYRWLFNRDGDLVALTILDFRSSFPSLPDEEGVAVFATRASLSDMAGAIVKGARAVLDEWGEDGYRAKWIEHPFPGKLLELVERRTGTVT